WCQTITVSAVDPSGSQRRSKRRVRGPASPAREPRIRRKNSMFLGGTKNGRSLLSPAVCFCCIFTLTVGQAGAQQLGGLVPATDNTGKTVENSKSAANTPKPVPENSKSESGKSELEEMSATVKQLEDRIRELEAKLARIESAAAPPAKVAGATPPGLTTAPAAVQAAKASADPEQAARKP